MNRHLKIILDNAWVELVIRWGLGITFIYASFHKIVSPEEFAKIIFGYDLFPSVLIKPIAIIVPFVELVSGTALILGIYPRSAALIVNGLLLAYITALSINLARGHEFDCGCFSLSDTGHVASPALGIVRNIICFFLGLHLLFYKRPRRWCIRQS